MKKIHLTLLFVLFSIVSFSQVTVRAFQAQIYTKSTYSGNWVLEMENKDIDIPILLYEDEIIIKAENPTHFKLKKNRSSEVNTENLVGSRYPGIEMKASRFCKVDVLRVRNSDYYVISILYEDDGLNLRYLINSND